MISSVDIKDIQTLYRGFSITAPRGNNAFSFPQRMNKEIYVPPFKSGTLNEIAVGQRIVFSEIMDGQEKNVHGLNGLWHVKHPSKHIFVVDNHNHVFFFWMWGWVRGLISKGSHLLHVDQHKDMRSPAEYLSLDGLSLEKMFCYTNEVLNVGNFIRPALKLEMFADVFLVDNKDAFTKKYPAPFVLDIDLDIFSKEMAYINEAYKIEAIRAWIKDAALITIATSPFFMDQNEALRILKMLLEDTKTQSHNVTNL